jgi:alpha-galactosidase
LILASSLKVMGAGQTEITVSKTPEGRDILYVSGQTVYAEGLAKGRWVAHYWDMHGAAMGSRNSRDEDAFAIEIKDTPTPPTMPGKLLAQGWQWVSASDLPASQAGSRHFVVELLNSEFPIRIKLHTLVDGTPVMERWMEITNTFRKPVALTGLFPWSGQLWPGGSSFTLGHSIRWDIGWEGWFGWTALQPGTNVAEQTRGLTYDDPYFFLQNSSRDEYFIGELAWPANYRMEFQNAQGLSFKIGPTAINALRVIVPGETITTPSVHLGCIQGDFDAAVQALHTHIRRSVLPRRDPDRAYRIQYLIPEDWAMTVYRGEAYNEANMKKCMDVAAAMGMELFILDGPMWGSAYGNWLVPNQKRFPRGLAPLVEYAHQKGLLFGLYMEPEGGRDGYTSRNGGATIGPWSASQVFQDHPHWFVQPQSVLNLSIPEAAQYMDGVVQQVISHYQLDLYRHDFNAPMRNQGTETLRDGFVECDYWRHYDAFYSTFRGVRERYPHVILQQASGGGSRLELATASVFDEHFSSDRQTMPHVYRALSGLSVYEPPEIFVGSNGMAWPPDRPDLDTTLRGAYALGNTPVIFNALLPKSTDELAPAMREKFLHYANLYKTFIRPALPTCKIYHFAPVNATGGVESGNWLAIEFAAPDTQKAWAVIIRLAKTEVGPYVLKPKGLDPQSMYRVTFDNTGKTEQIEGASLMESGLAIQPGADRESELLLFEKE